MFKIGDHVWADFGGGKELAHVVKGKHDVGGDEKYGIQGSAGESQSLTHREPEDRDGKGSGNTFWSL